MRSGPRKRFAPKRVSLKDETPDFNGAAVLTRFGPTHPTHS
jgi:hypothetical protein